MDVIVVAGSRRQGSQDPAMVYVPSRMYGFMYLYVFELWMLMVMYPCKFHEVFDELHRQRFRSRIVLSMWMSYLMLYAETIL